jgi:hypothetical protein
VEFGADQCTGQIAPTDIELTETVGILVRTDEARERLKSQTGDIALILFVSVARQLPLTPIDYASLERFTRARDSSSTMSYYMTSSKVNSSDLSLHTASFLNLPLDRLHCRRSELASGAQCTAGRAPRTTSCAHYGRGPSCWCLH